MSIRAELEAKGLHVADYVTGLRPMQEEADAWAKSQHEPYLIINAPTGSGKTLLLGVLGTRLGSSWTYGTHTIRLQEQATQTFPGLPVATGRAHHACEIGELTHKRNDITAAEAICVDWPPPWCEYMGREPNDEREWNAWSEHGGFSGPLCSYYAMRRRVFNSPYRTANYALILSDSQSFIKGDAQPRVTDILLADEAHAIDSVVCDTGEIRLHAPTFRKHGIYISQSMTEAKTWAAWGLKMLSRAPGGHAGFMIRRELLKLAHMQTSGVRWLTTWEDDVVRLRPVWGRDLAPGLLLGTPEDDVRRAIFASATILDGETFARSVGLPDGSWAYTELPHTFPTAHRPVNFSPVMRMNAGAVKDPQSRAVMQAAIDDLIERYMSRGVRGGLIHSVSNAYRDYMLTESRFRAIMTSNPEDHAAFIEAGQFSVLVAANLAEGWDGVGDLCRFTIIPKVPYADLGDVRVQARREEEPATYDYDALVKLIQMCGRGVRSVEDYCDTWILDESWGDLLRRRRSSIPKWFNEAYLHGVSREF